MTTTAVDIAYDFLMERGSDWDTDDLIFELELNGLSVVDVGELVDQARRRSAEEAVALRALVEYLRKHSLKSLADLA